MDNDNKSSLEYTGPVLADTVPHYKLQEAVRLLIEYCGRSLEEEGMRDTPDRVLKALWEMTEGQRDILPSSLLGRQFEVGGPYDEIIVLVGIPFVSLCEHHMLPFVGTVDVGYLPQDKVVGLSKLARLVDCFSKRLQIQERMTTQIAEAIMNKPLQARGVGVVVRADHTCLSCRGVKKTGATMITSSMLGLFRSEPTVRGEFLSLCNTRT